MLLPAPLVRSAPRVRRKGRFMLSRCCQLLLLLLPRLLQLRVLLHLWLLLLLLVSSSSTTCSSRMSVAAPGPSHERGAAASGAGSDVWS